MQPSLHATDAEATYYRSNLKTAQSRHGSQACLHHIYGRE